VAVQYQAVTAKKKLDLRANPASDLAALRRFVLKVELGGQPHLEELRVVAGILGRAIYDVKKRGPKSYFDVFASGSLKTPKAIRYLKMVRATKSQIAAGNSPSRAIALVAERMDVSLDTVLRVWSAFNEYMEILRGVISDDGTLPDDPEIEALEAAVLSAPGKAQNLKK
jgi:hypothetical protein